MLPRAQPADQETLGISPQVQWMWERGVFPLDQIVHLDPDLVKASLPEWDEYIAREPLAAGQHTRRESGYLVEIAQEVAMAWHGIA
jgi:hypothetical protein